MANNVRAWSTTAANNGTADSDINAAEGCPPSAVNDAERHIMAKLKNTLMTVEYLDHGYTATFATTTTFASPGDLTAIYLASRRLKFDCGTTLYGTIRSASYVASNTTVTMVMDSGTTLSSSLSAVYVGALAPTNPSAPATFDKNNHTLTTGTSTAYVAAPVPGLAALDNGTKVRIKFHTANGATPTLAVSSLTATTMKGPGNVALAGNEYTADTVAEFVYDSTATAWVGVGAPQSSVSAATQTQVDTGSASSVYTAPNTLLAAAWHGATLENRIINPEALVTNFSASTSDNGYAIDGARLLLEAANAATFSRVTSSLPTGARAAFRLTVGSGNNNKFGLFFPLENQAVADMLSGKIVLGFQCKATAGLSNIKAGIMEWTSTADGISADPISSWGADGTTPTLAANWAFLNTPANLSVGTSYAAITPITATVGASMTNLGVFIWNDDKTTTQTTDQLEFTMVDLRHGIGLLPYRGRPKTVDELLCARYYARWAYSASHNHVVGAGLAEGASGDLISVGIRMSVPTMRTTPTMTVSSISAKVSGANASVTSLTAVDAGQNGLLHCLTNTLASGMGADNHVPIYIPTGGSLVADARL